MCDGPASSAQRAKPDLEYSYEKYTRYEDHHAIRAGGPAVHQPLAAGGPGCYPPDPLNGEVACWFWL